MLSLGVTLCVGCIGDYMLEVWCQVQVAMMGRRAGASSSLHWDSAIHPWCSLLHCDALLQPYTVLQRPTQSSVWAPICPASDSWDSGSARVQGTLSRVRSAQATKKGKAAFYSCTVITRSRQVKKRFQNIPLEITWKWAIRLNFSKCIVWSVKQTIMNPVFCTMDTYY